jgi:hypothetical protein
MLLVLTGSKKLEVEGEADVSAWYALSALRIVTTVNVVIAGHYSPTVNALGFPELSWDVLEL